ncbi:MAG TPA: YbaK/EbsC family protein [Nocardioidaceae bacterium]|nr:YbaK/EbsC family protein [Nocardioidaceae bacterium]
MTPDLDHPQIKAVRAALDAAGATGELRILPGGVRTAQAAADALGCLVGAIANSLVFDADGEPVLILTSGAHRVDTEHVARNYGLPTLGKATPDFVRRHTGQVIGGVAPVGHPAPLRTFVDRWLTQHETVWAAAGHSHAVFATTYDELLELTGGDPVDVA